MWLLTLKSVLVATDLGETSGSPLQAASRLASLAGARLHLLHVADRISPASEDRLRKDLRLGAPDVPEPDSLRVIVGTPAAAIVSHASEVGADVVILGPYRGRDDARALGSTATRVVRGASCPCLVAATELRLPLKRVLVPVDVSDLAEGALSVALTWSSALRPRGGTVGMEALHVAEEPDAHTAFDRMREEVERVRRRTHDAFHVDITERVVSGSHPADEILREAADTSADLLVMGTHGMDDAASELGSVSAAVVRAAPCPLLLVPPAVVRAAMSL